MKAALADEPAANFPPEVPLVNASVSPMPSACPTPSATPRATPTASDAPSVTPVPSATPSGNGG